MERKHALHGAALAAALWIGTSCTIGPFEPAPGTAAWREPATFAVRDGSLELAGGNLLLRRTDLTIETRLGTQAVTHVYNSATDRWTWSFEMTYANGVFTDDTGAQHVLDGEPAGPIAGTRWRKVDAKTIESRGGLRFSFAPDGRLAQVRWRHASAPRLELQRLADGVLRIAQCTAADACADVFVVQYSGPNVTSIVDRAGRRCAYGYAGGRFAWVETPFDRERGLAPRRYAYGGGHDGRALRVQVTNPEGERARYDLDAEGRVVATILIGEESPRWTFRYQPFRTVATDPLGRETELRFEAGRRLVEVHEVALGERTRFTWSGRRITRVVTPDGLTASARYDAADEPVEWTLPSGRRVEAAYAPGSVHLADPYAALPSRVSDAGQLVVQRSFDAQGRLASETNGAGERIQFHYGPLETLARVELPSGLSVRFAEYGEHGRPVEIRVPSPEPDERDFVERREFDAVGDMTRGSEPGSESGTQFPGVVARRFDVARNVEALVMSKSPEDEAPYDIVLERRSDGRLRAIRRPYGASAELAYDGLGRVREQRERVDGGWAVTRFAWTPLGQLARSERPNGMVQELDYDAAGRLVRRTQRRGGAFESEVRYLYQAGRLVGREDSTVPGPTRFDYDESGRVRSIAWPDREETRLSYDRRDRPLSATLLRSDGSLLRQLGVRYDAAGRETQLVDGAVRVYEEVYAAGRLAAIRHGNGVVRTLSYDEFGRPSGAVARNAAGDEVETETVVRQGRTYAGPDPNGPFRETLASYQAATAFGPVEFRERAIGFRYVDGARWLAGVFGDSATVQWCSGACATPAELNYHHHSGLMDLERERLPIPDGSVHEERIFVKNAERNRLHGVIARTITLPTPPCGSCIPAVSDVWEHRYTWDEAGFATSRNGVPITWHATGHLASFGAATFERDAEGRLRGSVIAGVATRRRFGGLVETDASGHPLRIDLGSVELDLATNARSYRHFDWRGNVRSVWDDDGELRSVREYGAYGLARRHGEAGGVRGFAQGVEAAGLVVLGDRIYDPEARQFLSPDPVYSVFHQHVYGAGDPAVYWDWTGRSAKESMGFQLAGTLGGLLGAGVSIGTGAIASLASANPAPLAIGGVLAPYAAAHNRAWFEFLYTLAYDWWTQEAAPAPAAPPSPTPASHSWFPYDPFAVSGPGHPKWVGPGERWTGPELRNQGGPRGAGEGLAFPSFAIPAPACGLLGAEPLILLALCLRRRARSRQAAREGSHR
ncbi:MAG TPA: hypothetical protein VLC53_16895 [Myxococcota bacterium]|nr:hypothetical protein [Myxococcota bacterium]